MSSNENYQVVNLVQAMLGSISCNIRAVSLLCSELNVTINFLLERDHKEDREEIEDIEFEFAALQSSNVDVDVVIRISEQPIREGDVPGRMVYLRREPDEFAKQGKP